MNIADPTQSFVDTTLGYLFDYAAGTNFKLFISMDVTASGIACAAGRPCCNGVSFFPYNHKQYFVFQVDHY